MQAVIFAGSGGPDVVVVAREPIPDALRSEIRAIGGRVEAEVPPAGPGQVRREYDAEQLARFVESKRELDAIANMTDETDTEEMWDEIWRALGVGAP